MTTAIIASRASDGLPLPAYITAVIIMTSMPVTASVRISVPNGSPRFAASTSAWWTMAKAERRITPNNQMRISPNQSGFERSANHTRPKARKRAVVTRLTSHGHSRESAEVRDCFLNRQISLHHFDVARAVQPAPDFDTRPFRSLPQHRGAGCPACARFRRSVLVRSLPQTRQSAAHVIPDPQVWSLRIPSPLDSLNRMDCI